MGQSPLIAALRNSSRALLEWVYPSHCLICGRSAPNPTCVCTICLRDLPEFPAPLCPVCGHFLPEGEPHRLCEPEIENYPSLIWALGVFDDAYRPLVHALKYHRQLRLGEHLGRRLGRRIARSAKKDWNNRVLLPVPLHPSRERNRGYNQSSWLTRGIAHQTGWTVMEDVLVRTRRTKDQTRLSPEQRQSNLRDAFTVTNPGTLKDRPVMLIDDVLTTGATLRECARILYKAGVFGVSAAVCAIAQPAGAGIFQGR
jgi:ComF family protein